VSIELLKRVSLVGSLAQKHAAMDRLQALGCMHLVPLVAQPSEPEQRLPLRAEDTRKALRYLVDERRKRRQLRSDDDFDMAATVERVLENRDRLRRALDHRDMLAQRARDLAAWGDFSLPPAEEIGGRRLWFYTLPLRQLHALEALELPWQIVHRDNRQAFVVLISCEEPADDILPVPRDHTGSHSLGEVREALEAAESALDEARAERQELTRYLFLLSKHFARAEDRAVLRHAQTQTLDDDHLFAVQGWVGASRLTAVEALADEQGLALVIEDPAPGDTPPTLLLNPPEIGAGEDLVRFYQMPAYGAFDPSRVLFFSFALFFAMILADAGYAAFLGLLLLAFWRRLGRTASGRRFRTLATTIVSASVLFGVAVGSYFGVAPTEDGIASRLQVFDLNNFDAMIRLSVGVGVAHVVLANLVRLGSLWPRRTALAPLGWSLAALSGFTLWLSTDSGREALAVPAWTGLLTGLGLVFLFSSERSGGGLRETLLRGVDGLLALTSISKLFGDTLSYLRLFALGLASASLAITFNELALEVRSVPGLGLLLELLLLLIGHSLNLLLALVSGVIHGLRLNYIEFYNWALSGEGYPFRPFEKTEIKE
jgi:V/A-type H+-transporting ATPase subunit I